MRPVLPESFAELYQHFRSPIAAINCGDRCAPYNEHGVPFCCDTRHAVPTAYHAEWSFLKANTNLWHPYEPETKSGKLLFEELPDGQVLIECLGHPLCQRNYRSITCRSFPFFPYITAGGTFLGITYYWEYEDRCWVISNVSAITPEYLSEFVTAYETLFQLLPGEMDNFKHHSAHMRRVFKRRNRTIPLIHRNGASYKISPSDERMRRTRADRLPKYYPYNITARLPFKSEIS